MEVILYGGNKELGGSFIANAVVLTFGKYLFFIFVSCIFNTYVGPTDAFPILAICLKLYIAINGRPHLGEKNRFTYTTVVVP